MSYLFAVMREWADELADAAVTVQFSIGDANRPRRAAWVSLEAPLRVGQVTIWDSGEAEYECYDRRTEGQETLESTTATTAAEVKALLARLLAECSQS